MKTLQMNQKADYGNWVPAAMMKTLWTATAAIAIVTVLMFVLIKSPVPGVIGIVVRKGGAFAFQDMFGQKALYGDMEAFCEELLKRYTEPSEEVRRSEAI